MTKFNVTLSGNTMEEIVASAKEFAAVEGAKAVKAAESQKVKNKTDKTEKVVDEPQAAKTAVDSDEPEIATRNRWIELVDGTMIEVRKGEELPPEDQRARNVQKKEYQAWEQAQLSGESNEKEKEDEGFDDDDFDDFEDDKNEESEDDVIDFKTFKQLVKLFGGKNPDRAKNLMKRHSQNESSKIGQFEEDVEGRAAVVEELKEKWKNYDKAIAKVTAE